MTSITPAAQLGLNDENYDRVLFGSSHNLRLLALFENETLSSRRSVLRSEIDRCV